MLDVPTRQPGVGAGRPTRADGATQWSTWRSEAEQQDIWQHVSAALADGIGSRFGTAGSNTALAHWSWRGSGWHVRENSMEQQAAAGSRGLGSRFRAAAAASARSSADAQGSCPRHTPGWRTSPGQPAPATERSIIPLSPPAGRRFADPLVCASAPPCRLVVRFTNRNVVCQVAYATMAGDKVICAAYRCEGALCGVLCGQTPAWAVVCCLCCGCCCVLLWGSRCCRLGRRAA